MTLRALILLGILIVSQLTGCNNPTSPHYETSGDTQLALAVESASSRNEKQRKLIERVRSGDGAFVRQLLADVQPEDRWVLPLFADLLRHPDRTISWAAVHCMWVNFPEESIELSRRALEHDLEQHTARSLALELSRHDALTHQAQHLLETDCQKRSSRAWGLTFLDGPVVAQERVTGGQTFEGSGHIPQVAYICRGGDASQSALEVGDLILQVDDRFLNGSDFLKVLRERDELTLSVRRGKKRITLALERSAE